MIRSEQGWKADTPSRTEHLAHFDKAVSWDSLTVAGDAADYGNDPLWYCS